MILTEKEKKQDGLAREILAFSRNTLLVNLRFLDSALSMLHLHRMGEGTQMTDGSVLLIAICSASLRWIIRCGILPAILRWKT